MNSSQYSLDFEESIAEISSQVYSADFDVSAGLGESFPEILANSSIVSEIRESSHVIQDEIQQISIAEEPLPSNSTSVINESVQTDNSIRTSFVENVYSDDFDSVAEYSQIFDEEIETEHIPPESLLNHAISVKLTTLKSGEEKPVDVLPDRILERCLLKLKREVVVRQKEDEPRWVDAMSTSLAWASSMSRLKLETTLAQMAQKSESGDSAGDISAEKKFDLAISHRVSRMKEKLGDLEFSRRKDTEDYLVSPGPMFAKIVLSGLRCEEERMTGPSVQTQVRLQLIESQAAIDFSERVLTRSASEEKKIEVSRSEIFALTTESRLLRDRANTVLSRDNS